MTQWRLLALTLSTLAFSAAVLAMWPIFGDPRIVLVGAVALLVGTGLAALGWWRRWSPLTLLIVGILAYLVLAPPLAAPDRLLGILPTGAAYAVVLPATWESWRDILTLTTPVGTGDGMLVAPLILVLAGSMIASSIVLRTQRAELAGIAPSALAVWAILWGPREEWQPVLLAVLVMLTVVGLVTVVRQARRRRASPRTLSSLGRRVVAGVTVGAAAIGCGIVGGIVPLGDRVVLRDDEPADVDVSTLASPLAAFRGWLMPDVRDDVVMTVTGLEPGDSVELAVLDAYDGEIAGVGGASSFQRMTAQPATGELMGVTVQSLDGPWVPHMGSPTSVTFVGPRAPDLQDGLHVDDETDGVLVTAGLETGDAYELSYEPAPETPPLASLTPAGVPDVDAEPPEDAVTQLSAWTSDASTPGERLDALVAGILADGYVSHGIDDDEVASRAGHSLERIQELFEGIMVGDGEQYAVAAALLAEQLGFPARVVLGFTPEVVEGQPTQIVGSDIAAWIEVSTREAGWVAVQVTPPERPVPEDETTAPQPAQQPEPPLPPVLPEGGQQPDDAPVPPIEPETVPQPDDTIWQIVGWAAAGLGLLTALAAPFVLLLGAKALRRRRRRRADPVPSVDGAWQELVDAVVDRGGPAQGTRTRIEYARGEEQQTLARQVDAALFGAADPDETAVEAAWRSRDAAIATLDADRSRLGRILARLSPRSLARRAPRR